MTDEHTEKLAHEIAEDIREECCYEEWYKSDITDRIEVATKIMVTAGMDAQTISNILGGIISAIKNEYGD